MQQWRVRRQGGFTLVEILLVCGLVSLLTALAVPSFAASADSLRLRNATHLLAADIRLTQILAQQEARRTRLLLTYDSGSGTYSGYEVQVATNAMTGESCETADYETVKRVDLAVGHRVSILNPTLECLVFEPTGRTAWRNPRVLESHSDTPDGEWIRFLDGVEKSGTTTVLSDERAIKWNRDALQSRRQDQITMVIDLGQARSLEWICAQMLERRSFEGVYFPSVTEVYWSTVTGDMPPLSSEWDTQAFSMTNSPVELVPGSTSVTRTCPRLQVRQLINQRVRYLKYVFDTRYSGSNPKKVLALDEIKLPSPGMTVQNDSGRGSRTVTIAPVTGSVTVD